MADTHDCQARLALGTLVEIRGRAASSDALASGFDAAFTAIARVHTALSGHDPDSELSRVNSVALLRAHPVSPDLRAVLDCALDVARVSAGAFDPAVGARVCALGFLPDHADAGADVVSADKNGRWCDVELDAAGVRFARPLRLDLDGIAKGYAVDCAIAALQRHGVAAARVNAGGDLRVYGERVPVHVRTSGACAIVTPLVELADGAVATSAFGDRRQLVDRRWATPLVEPRSGLPVMATRTVSVVAPTCMLADALTKVVALRGPGSARVLAHYHAGAAWLSPSREGWRTMVVRPIEAAA
jgi:thiamine biosynthesis lipoprotein